MIIVGLMAGRVICHSWRKRLAPSILAASYNCVSTPASAARNIIVPQPVSFQMTSPVIKPRNHSGAIRN
ncbi:hypothetical protein D3C75_1363870 [compost metagenome]